ncbi:MAG TPA: hypothetical protein PKD12_17145 [Nitrospira sp.]|nr:hypothetical protein [Nitrospira sp.]
MRLGKAAALVATSTLVCSALAISQTGQMLTPTEAQDIRQFVLILKDAILRQGLRHVLQLVSKDGLICTDTLYPHKEVKAFLEDKKSHLYMSLFDTTRLSQKCGHEYAAEYPAISEKDFLQSVDESFVIKRIEVDWAAVTLTSPNPRHYPRRWSFHRENGKWKVAGDNW